MNKQLLFLIILFAGSSVFAQIKFEKGYFISGNGQKTDCYIKNVDWINNPESFDYRLSLEGNTKTAKLASVQSFAIPNVFKYEKHTVNIDMSTKELSRLNYDKNPEWQEKTVFLNVLVEGDATLYHYKNAELSRFFYKKGNGNVQQLVRKYYLSTDRKLVENNEYRQQLYTDLACASISRNRVSRLRYNRNDLTKFFVEYNTCKNGDFSTYKQKNKSEIHLRAEIGMMSQKTRFATKNSTALFRAYNSETEQKWSPKIGIEFEYVLPFNKNKWAAFIAPYYQSYEAEGEAVSDITLVSVPTLTYEIAYSAIQIPIGFRHYMYLNDKSKLFINAGVIVDIPLKTEFSSNLLTIGDDFKTAAGGIFGIGYNYDKYFVEARIVTARELLENRGNVSIDLTQFSFTVGYRFL